MIPGILLETAAPTSDSWLGAWFDDVLDNPHLLLMVGLLAFALILKRVSIINDTWIPGILLIASIIASVVLFHPWLKAILTGFILAAVPVYSYELFARYFMAFITKFISRKLGILACNDKTLSGEK